MSRLSDKHLISIDRTLTIMRIFRNRQKVPKYQKELDRDIKHLSEITQHIHDSIDIPTFGQLQNTACPMVV